MAYVPFSIASRSRDSSATGQKDTKKSQLISSFFGPRPAPVPGQPPPKRAETPSYLRGTLSSSTKAAPLPSTASLTKPTLPAGSGSARAKLVPGSAIANASRVGKLATRVVEPVRGGSARVESTVAKGKAVGVVRAPEPVQQIEETPPAEDEIEDSQEPAPLLGSRLSPSVSSPVIPVEPVTMDSTMDPTTAWVKSTSTSPFDAVATLAPSEWPTSSLESPIRTLPTLQTSSPPRSPSSVPTVPLPSSPASQAAEFAIGLARLSTPPHHRLSSSQLNEPDYMHPPSGSSLSSLVETIPPGTPVGEVKRPSSVTSAAGAKKRSRGENWRPARVVEEVEAQIGAMATPGKRGGSVLARDSKEDRMREMQELMELDEEVEDEDEAEELGGQARQDGSEAGHSKSGSSRGSDSEEEDEDDLFTQMLKDAKAKRAALPAGGLPTPPSTTSVSLNPSVSDSPEPPSIRRSSRAHLPVKLEPLASNQVEKKALLSASGGLDATGQHSMKSLMLARKVVREGWGGLEEAKELLDEDDELLRNSDDDTPPPGAVDLLSGDELKRIARKIGAEGAAEEDDALITASARRRSVALRQGLLDEFERDSNRVVLDLCGSAGVGELERRGRGVWEWLSGVGASKALPPPTAGLGKWGESIVLAFEGTGVPPVSLLLFSTVSGVGSEPERRIVARWLFLLITHVSTSPKTADQALLLLHKIFRFTPASLSPPLFVASDLWRVLRSLGMKPGVWRGPEQELGGQAVEINGRDCEQRMIRLLGVVADLVAQSLFPVTESVTLTVAVIQTALDPTSLATGLRRAVDQVLPLLVDLIYTTAPTINALLSQVDSLYRTKSRLLQLELLKVLPSSSPSHLSLNRWLSFAFLLPTAPSFFSVLSPLTNPPLEHLAKVVCNVPGPFKISQGMDNLALHRSTLILGVALARQGDLLFREVELDRAEGASEGAAAVLRNLQVGLREVERSIRTDVRGSPDRNLAKNSITQLVLSLEYQLRAFDLSRKRRAQLVPGEGKARRLEGAGGLGFFRV